MRDRSFLASLFVIWMGCGGSTSPGVDAATSPEDGMPRADAGVAESDAAGLDAGQTPGDAASPATYTDVASASNWEHLGLASVGLTDLAYASAAFDGRYLYFAPGYDGLSQPQARITRVDTQGAISASATFEQFDVSTVNPKAKEWSGAVFDGRYVYFSPSGKNSEGRLLTRYDTQAGFTSAAAWSFFDSDLLPSHELGFRGAAFDGKYVYFSGGQSGTAYNPYAVRYDSTKPFDQATSWDEYLTTLTLPNAAQQDGVTAVGRSVYFNVIYAGGGYAATILRYDADVAFGAATSWSKMDLTTITPGTAYSPGFSDGKYVYWANGTTGKIVRLDTTKPFTQAASWEIFDGTTVDAHATSMTRGGFDGRYAYFTPSFRQAPNQTLLLRYDTQAAFGAQSAWTVTNLASFGAAYYGTGALAFDGRYVYLPPSRDDAATLMRFDARAPAGGLPPGGSFY